MSDTRNRTLLNMMIAVTGLAGAALVAAGMARAGTNHVPILAALIAIAFGSEVFAVALFADSHVSVSGAAVMAAGAVFGIFGVACTAPAVALAGHLRTRRDLAKSVFNFGAYAIAGAAYVAVFGALAGDLAHDGFPSVLGPALAAGLANMAVNSTLVATAIALSGNRSIAEVWKQNYLWLVPEYAVLACVGIGMAVAAIDLGVWSLAVFALPAASLTEALRTRADAMRSLRGGRAETPPAHRAAA